MDAAAKLLLPLLRLLGRGPGNVRASLRDLRNAREILRFAALFAATILLPALILSTLALNSIRSAELQFDVELRARSDAMAEQIHQDLAAVFGRFEAAIVQRLERGESPVNNLGEISPFLRGAYRFDASGDLAAPFVLEEAPPLPTASAAWRRAMTRGSELEQGRRYPEAAAAYREAAASTGDDVFAAEALLALARATAANGEDRVAEDMLADLYSDYANVRESRGFRMADLTHLKRAELRFRRDPDVGQIDLMELVDPLLGAGWVVGRGGEAAVAKRALALLSGHVDPDWLANARTRLGDRADQLYWAEVVREELEVVNVRTPAGLFRYLSRADSPSLWATFRADETYAFSFTRDGLLTELASSSERIGALDNDLVAMLQTSDDKPRGGALTSRTLDPWMASVRVVVLPRDPDALAARKSTQRRTRVFVVVVALFMVFVGVVFAANMIGREIEGARMKADFAANVSHELRSPITQIRLKGEALQLGLVEPGDDTVAHYDAIVREAERLSRLVDNVLDFAAIERGAKRYQLRRDDLGAVVWSTVDSNRAAVEERGLELFVDIPDDLPPVWMDRDAISQVLVNLLSNAAKYGADGGTVSVQVRVGLDGVEMSVADRGMGILPQDIERIFEHFYRSTDPKVRRSKGTGIGLTIVRYIVEAHGGSIAVDSAPGRGATFTITFPLEAPDGLGDRS